jgi:hypothetical protein
MTNFRLTIASLAAAVSFAVPIAAGASIVEMPNPDHSLVASKSSTIRVLPTISKVSSDGKSFSTSDFRSMRPLTKSAANSQRANKQNVQLLAAGIATGAIRSAAADWYSYGRCVVGFAGSAALAGPAGVWTVITKYPWVWRACKRFLNS